MQSVMQMFVVRFASRNPCISQMLVPSKQPKEYSLSCLYAWRNR